MRGYTLTHLSDDTLLHGLATLVARDRTTTADMLAHIAEVDARKLYRPAAYPSMHAYCVGELRFSDDATYKRIQAARAARQFPAIFTAVAEGRLHLSAVCLLAPHLTAENVDELLTAATHQSKSEVEQLLARRFPSHQGPAMVPVNRAVPSTTFRQLAPGQVDGNAHDLLQGLTPAPPPEETSTPQPESFPLQLRISRDTQDRLRYAQALLSHAVPSGDVAEVFDRALVALIGTLERRKFGATGKPCKVKGSQPSSRSRGRYIPLEVRRAVWERDGRQCTFVSERGHRCPATRFLEFDHIDPVARGGEATVGGMRLRCRAHNQYEAECTFGADFMRRKREQARARAEEARVAAAEAQARVEVGARASVASEQTQDVIAGLRALGFRADEARRAAARTESLHDAQLEERMRAALKSLGRRPTVHSSVAAVVGAST